MDSLNMFLIGFVIGGLICASMWAIIVYSPIELEIDEKIKRKKK